MQADIRRASCSKNARWRSLRTLGLDHATVTMNFRSLPLLYDSQSRHAQTEHIYLPRFCNATKVARNFSIKASKILSIPSVMGLSMIVGTQGDYISYFVRSCFAMLIMWCASR